MTLGGGNKSGLFQVLNTDYSPQVAAECMNRLAKLRWARGGEGRGRAGQEGEFVYGMQRWACGCGCAWVCVCGQGSGLAGWLPVPQSAGDAAASAHPRAVQLHPPAHLPPAPPSPPTHPRSARFIGDRGFSIGIDDVTPALRLQQAKAQTLEAG